MDFGIAPSNPAVSNPAMNPMLIPDSGMALAPGVMPAPMPMMATAPMAGPSTGAVIPGGVTMQTMQAGDKEAMAQERIMKRLEDNTHRNRLLEGRPKHGLASSTMVVLGVIGELAMLMSIGVCHWRATWVGIVGYSNSRAWGLLGVQGRTFQFHHELLNKAQEVYGLMATGGLCVTPICIWYKLKAQVYLLMCFYSYVAAAMLMYTAVWQAIVVVWSVMFTPKLIRWTSNLYPILWLCHTAAVVFWFIMSSTCFDDLNVRSYYPEPPPSPVGTLLVATTFLCQSTNIVLSLTTRSMWPDPSMAYDDESSDSSDDESSEDEEEYVDRKNKEHHQKMAQDPVYHQQVLMAQQQQQQQAAMLQQQQQQQAMMAAAAAAPAPAEATPQPPLGI